MNVLLTRTFKGIIVFFLLILFCHFPQRLLSRRIFPSGTLTQNVPISSGSIRYSDFAIGLYPYPGESQSGALAFWQSATSFILWRSRWIDPASAVTLSGLPSDDGNSSICCIQQGNSAALLCTNGVHYLLQTQDRSIQKIFSGQDASGNDITVNPLSKIAYNANGDLYVFYGISSGGTTNLLCASNGQIFPLIYTSTATTVHPAFFVIDQADLAYFFFIEGSQLYWRVYDLANKTWKTTASKVLIPVPTAVFSGTPWKHNGVHISIQTFGGIDTISFLLTDASGNMYLCEKAISGSSANLASWDTSEVKKIPIAISPSFTPQVLLFNGMLFLVFAPLGNSTLNIAYRYPSSGLWITEPLEDLSLTPGTQPNIINRSFFMHYIMRSNPTGWDRIDAVYSNGASIYNKASADSATFKLKNILDQKL